MNRIKYCFLLSFTLCCNFCFAQGDGQILVNAIVAESGINISWFPTNVDQWKDGLNSGYTLSRETLKGGNEVFIAKNILPKNAEWFKLNVSQNNGVLLPIGEILYNPDFSLPTAGNSGTWALKYNYIVYETTINHSVALAVGLGFSDMKVTKGAQYKYTITHNQSGRSQSILVTVENGNVIKEPKNFKSEFSFPDGNSLSDMLQLSKPFVLQAIIGKARPKLDSIILRWGPSTPELWRNAMEDGYDIYRKDEENNRNKIATVFPWKEDLFRQIPKNDSIALLAASFVAEKGQPKKMENYNFFEKSNMASNYHGFALMIADRSALAADILGLRYVDLDVKPGEVYVYEIETKRLKSNLPPLDIRVVNEFEPLLSPEGFSIIKGEKQVTIQWLSKSNLTSYGSYIVERIKEGDSTFQIITNPPLVFIRESSVSQPYYQFIDSLSNNYDIYRYRLKGSNAFGEWSEYAYGIGFGIDKTPPEPVFVQSSDFEEASERLRISWKLPSSIGDVKYHQVLLSEHQDYNFSAVSGELAPTDTVFYFSVKEMFTDRPFYFKVMSVDSSGNDAMSIIRYVSVPDIEKPLAPENLKVTIDSTGRIQAVWSPSKSHDVLGYYIYYSNDNGTDLTMYNDFLHKDTIFTWTIPINTLTKNIYIGVKSEDDNYNRSFISGIIKLRRPDTIPPPKPFLTQVILEPKIGVYLHWKKSSASDIEQYIVFRKNNADTIVKWIAIDTLTKFELEYYDINFPHNTQLDYAIKAVDDFNNISEFSNVIPINIPFPKNKYLIGFHKLNTNSDMSVDIEWNKVDSKITNISVPHKYQLFRSTGNDELSLYKEFDSNQNNFKDTIEQKNVLYNYAIRVKFDHDRVGELSDVKSILVN